MKTTKTRKIMGYIALALVCVMAGTAIGVNLPAATAADGEPETVVLTSPFTAAIAKVRDSVVGVNNYQLVNTYGNGYGSYGYGYPYGFGYGYPYGFGYGYPYGNDTQPNTNREVKYGSGSGVVVAKDYVLTNYHVIEGSSSLKISLDDGDTTQYDATVAAYDETKDIAVLHVPGLPLEPVALGDSDALQVGDWVVTIGNAIGFTRTATAGIVSALNREIESDTTTTDRFGRRSAATNTMIQTDAAINSGNSGGGLFNTAGELVGIPTLKYSGTRYNGASIESIGMCIPINEAKPVIEKALGETPEAGEPEGNAGTDPEQQPEGQETANDRRGKPRFGVTVTTLQRVETLPEGAYILSVDAESPAEKAGLLPGDIIVEIGDKQIKSSDDMIAALEGTESGDTLTVTVWRPATVMDAQNGYFDTVNGQYVENLQVTLEILEKNEDT